MKIQDIYSLVIRTVGLLGILYVVRHLAKVAHKTGTPHFDEPLYLVYELGLICIGFYMVFGMPGLFKLLFSNRDRKDDEDENGPHKPQD